MRGDPNFFIRNRIIGAIAEKPASTSEEIAAALHLTVKAVRPRICELRDAATIRPVGRIRAPSGRLAHQWSILK